MQNNTKTRFRILFDVPILTDNKPNDSSVQNGTSELEKEHAPVQKSKLKILFDGDRREKLEELQPQKKSLKIVFSNEDTPACQFTDERKRQSKIKIDADKTDSSRPLVDPKKLGFPLTKTSSKKPNDDDLYLEGEKRHGDDKNRTIAYPVTMGIILAEEYRSGAGRTPCVDPTGWWASEKYDGIRVLWDGISLWTRAMNQVNAPVSFQSRLPPGFSLDGELFIKRDHFNETSGIVRNKVPNLEHWEPMKLMVFDIPHLGHVYPFEKRLEILKETVHRYGEPLVYVNHIRVKSAAHLDEIHRSLLSKGAEGTMIRAPRSYYEGDRSMTLLKVKDQYDAECIVEGWEEGKNRNQGHLGALEISWEDPIAVWERYGNEHDTPYHGIFKVGSGLTQVERVPIEVAPELFPRGTRIRVAFSQLQKSGKPKHPAYKGRV